MPRLSPKSPRRSHKQRQSRYIKRLKTTKLPFGCKKDNHDERPVDESNIDDVGCSKSWPGGSTPKSDGEEDMKHKNSLPKPTKLKFNCEDSASEENTHDIFSNDSSVFDDVFDNEETESDCNHESESEQESINENEKIN